MLPRGTAKPKSNTHPCHNNFRLANPLGFAGILSALFVISSFLKEFLISRNLRIICSHKYVNYFQIKGQNHRFSPVTVQGHRCPVHMYSRCRRCWGICWRQRRWVKAKIQQCQACTIHHDCWFDNVNKLPPWGSRGPQSHSLLETVTYRKSTD